MDDTDRALLACCARTRARRRPARAPARPVAHHGAGRLERLERSGVISGYGVRLSDEAERGLIRAHVLITILPKAAPRIEAELRAIAEVRTLHSVSGSST